MWCLVIVRAVTAVMKKRTPGSITRVWCTAVFFAADWKYTF